MRLADRVSIITGAGSGVGRATALLFAREGAKVVAAGRTLSKVEETASMVAEQGGECLAVRCDVASSEDVQAMIRAAVERFGGLHVIVNNAGVGYSAEFADPPLSMQDVLNTPDEDCHAVMDILLTSVFLTSKYGIPAMLESGGGAIVNVSSGGGVTGMWDAHTYSAAKAGMNNLTRSLARAALRRAGRTHQLRRARRDQHADDRPPARAAAGGRGRRRGRAGAAATRAGAHRRARGDRLSDPLARLRRSVVRERRRALDRRGATA